MFIKYEAEVSSSVGGGGERGVVQDLLYGFPRLFTVTSEHIRLFYFLVFFCIYTFLVVGFMW